MYFIIFLLVACGSEAMVVETNLGPVRGQLVKIAEEHLEIYQFTGIPFAEPPVGERRFRKPEPKSPWTSEFDATKVPNSCPQLPPSGAYDNFVGLERIAPKGPPSEDCLTLDIFVPRTKLDELKVCSSKTLKRLPVLFFIHGGGFVSGASSCEVYNGTVLSAYNDVIVVLTQYRLGSLGFAYFGEEAGQDAPGNVGLWDQLEALKWVHQNIGSFGGDKDRITLGGNSAGGASVTYHLLSSHSKPYFSKATVQSGSALCPWAFRQPDQLKNLTDLAYSPLIARYCRKNPPSNLQEKLACLRSIDFTAFPLADFAPVFAGFGNFIFVPTVDGEFILKKPRELFEKGDFNKVPLMVGANKDEGSMFLMATPAGAKYLTMPNSPENPLMAELNFTSYQELMTETVALFRMNNIPGHALLSETVQLQYWSTSKLAVSNGQGYPFGNHVVKASVAASGDCYITCPVFKVVQQMVKSFEPHVYAYFFTQRRSGHVWPEWMGATHGDESGFFFGEPFNPYAKDYGYSADDAKLSRVMMAYWTNFIKFGNPNVIDLKSKNLANTKQTLMMWPSFTTEDCPETFIDLSNAAQVYNQTAGLFCQLKTRQCQFWSSYFYELDATLSRIDLKN